MQNLNFLFFTLSLVTASLLSCRPKETPILMPANYNRDIVQQDLMAFCNESIERDPENPSLYYHRAVLLSEQGQYKRAYRDIKKAIRLSDAEAKYFFQKAKIEAALKNNIAAATSAREAELRGYAYPDLQLLLGQLSFDNGDYATAEINFKKYRSYFPASPDINYQMGCIYQLRNDTAKAHAFFDQALDSDPNHEPTLTAMLTERNQVLTNNKSLLLVRQIDKEKVRTGELLFQIGRTYQLIGKRDSSYYFFQKAVNADPKQWLASYQLARKHVADQDYIKAERMFINALDQNPSIEGGYDQLGWIYEYALIDLTKAQEAYIRAQEFGSAKAIKSLRRVERRLQGFAPEPTVRKPDTVQTSLRQSRSIRPPRLKIKTELD